MDQGRDYHVLKGPKWLLGQQKRMSQTEDTNMCLQNGAGDFLSDVDQQSHILLSRGGGPSDSLLRSCRRLDKLSVSPVPIVASLLSISCLTQLPAHVACLCREDARLVWTTNLLEVLWLFFLILKMYKQAPWLYNGMRQTAQIHHLWDPRGAWGWYRTDIPKELVHSDPLRMIGRDIVMIAVTYVVSNYRKWKLLSTMGWTVFFL